MENDEQIPEESVLLSSLDTGLDRLHGSSLQGDNARLIGRKILTEIIYGVFPSVYLK